MRAKLKKTWYLMVIILFALCAKVVVFANMFEEHGFISVYTKEDLLKIGNELDWPLDGYYLLMNDLMFESIESQERNFNQIASNVDMPFSGVFDGNGKSIKGLLYRDESANVALFGYVNGENAVIRNLTLEDVDFSGNDVGALVYYISNGIIENCYVSGKITARSSVGSYGSKIFKGVIRDCHSTCDIISGKIAGGIVTIVGYEGIVTGCSYSGKLISNDNQATGGIAANNGGRIEKSFFLGSIVVPQHAGIDFRNSDCVGGIVGNNLGIIEKSYSSGRLECRLANSYISNQGVGGIAGSNYSIIRDCYTVGTIIGSWWVGGIAGRNSGEILKCYSTVEMSSNINPVMGGIAAVNNGLVDMSVSLVPAVMVQYGSNDSSGGRVVGMSGKNPLYFANNYAWREMEVVYGEIRKLTAENDCYMNGVSRGLSGLLVKEAYVELGWDFTSDNPIWEFSGEYKLPKLVGVGGQENLITPSHLM